MSAFCIVFCFFFNDTATTEIYTLSLHDALPIFEYAALARGPMDLHAEPPSFPRGGEVFALLPGLGLVGVASGGPAPKVVVTVVLQLVKGPLGRSVAVIVGPTAQQRVELTQERLLGEAQSGVNQPLDLVPQDLDFALCGGDQDRKSTRLNS